MHFSNHLRTLTKVQLNDHNSWNRMPTSHTLLIRFPLKAEVLYLMQIEIVVIIIQALYSGQSDTLSLLECANWKFWEFFFSFLCTLLLGRRLGWRALGEVCTGMKSRKATYYKRGPYFSSVATGTIIASSFGADTASPSALSIPHLDVEIHLLCPHYLFWIVVEFLWCFSWSST